MGFLERYCSVESIGKSFLSAPCIFLITGADAMQKKRAICQKKWKAPLCFPQQHFSDLTRSLEVSIDILSARAQKFLVLRPLAEVKHLESDDIDKISGAHMARLVALSV